MKKLLSILLITVFANGALAAAGCGDPCTKVADKLIECTSGKEAKAKMKTGKDKRIAACKKDEAGKKKAKKCAKIDDCAKFLECLGNTDSKQ